MYMSTIKVGVEPEVLSIEAQEAWRGMLGATRQLGKEVGLVIQDASGLSPQDFDVLVVLLETPGQTLRSSELAAAVNWDRSRLSHHAGRLEQKGLLLREPCSTDNRGVQFRITETGIAAIRQATGPHFRAVKHLFADVLSSRQLEELIEITSIIRSHIRANGRAAKNS
jgi:DNA-binding MarR family transcriptional regulator